jgi:acetyl-CoA carboxylase biotin carboxyl carrier protein
MDPRERITALADLMQEFGLAEAKLSDGDVAIGFRRIAKPAVAPAIGDTVAMMPELEEDFVSEESVTVEATGTPVTSPMTGIYYRSPSPSAPAFVKEGDEVAEGQVIGLIEAMKVFSEIPSPAAGTVVKMVAESGQLVQPGDVLVWIK